MKAFSGLMALFALSMLANAAQNQWAFEPSETGSKWVVLDIVIAILFAALSYAAFASASRAEMARHLQEYERHTSEAVASAAIPQTSGVDGDREPVRDEALKTEN